MLTKQNKNKRQKQLKNVFSTFTMAFMFANVVTANSVTACDHSIFKDSCLISELVFLGD